jgi:hypothetical protein
MADLDIQILLDEIIVLHSGIAVELLKSFPDAHGVHFLLDNEPASAFPRADLPPEYASEYGDDKFEARAKELLGEIEPRMEEICRELATVGITRRDLSVDAEKSEYRKTVGKLAEAVDIFGAIGGGLGSVIIKREMLAVNGKALAISPTFINLVSVVEDQTKVADIERAANIDLTSALKYLIENKLLISQAVPSRGDVKKNAQLLNWLKHLPHQSGECDFKYEGSVCRVIQTSDQRETVLYVPISDIDDPESKFIEFDPKRGFDIDDLKSDLVAQSMKI